MSSELSDDITVQVTRRGKNEVEIRIRGETYTIVDPLVSMLHRMGVEFAGYDVPHPLVEESILFVRTGEGDPLKVVKEAIDKLEEEYKELSESLKRELERISR